MVEQLPKNIVVKSIPEYFAKLCELGPPTWFRGESRDYGATRLTPRIWRVDGGACFPYDDAAPVITDAELAEIRKVQWRWSHNQLSDDEFSARWRLRPWHTRFMSKRFKDHPDWVFLAQHYGSDTRLLDVTADPIMALYFACSHDFDDDGIVWHGYGNYNVIEHRDLATSLRSMFDIFRTPDGAKPEPHTPFFLKPLASNTRMVAQFGMFMWTRAPGPVDSAPLAVHVDTTAKKEIKQILERWAYDPRRHLFRAAPTA